MPITRRSTTSVLAAAGLVLALGVTLDQPTASAHHCAYSGGGWICTGPGDPSHPIETDRISGADRYATAVAVSAAKWPEGADHVYLANGSTPWDALAGGASAQDGPILLVPTGQVLPASVADEITRLAPAGVTALGGSAAVSDAQLRAAELAAETALP